MSRGGKRQVVPGNTAPTIEPVHAVGATARPPGSGPVLSRGWWDDAVLAVVCVAVIVFYAWRCDHAVSELGNTGARHAYYNLLVEGFQAGQLNLRVEAPAGLAQLRDPWDPEANAPFRKKLFVDDRLHDTSYYGGKIYLYFSPTPALLLFWPYHALTGGYLEHRTAVAVFCSVGFLIGVILWRAICSRYFPGRSTAILAAGALALGMANSVPVMMARPDVWEVPISCAYALTMATLAALWRALHDPPRLGRWLALASAAFALAVSARPSLLPAAPILLIPLIPWWRSRKAGSRDQPRLLTALAAVAVPLALIGVALAWYNQARFGNPLDFGQRYQLAQVRQDDARHFSLAYLWYNFRLYFLSVAPWSDVFPFVSNVAIPPLPAGHGDVDGPFGILVNTPFALFALGLPYAGRTWSGGAPLRWFVAVVATLFLIAATILCLFFGTCTRYQIEFHPALVILAAIAAGALHEAWRTRSPRIAQAIGILAVAAVAFSTLFSVLKGYQKTAELLYARGAALDAKGDFAGALGSFEQTKQVAPRMADAWLYAGIEYHRLGQPAPAVENYQQCIRLDPANLTARNNLGALLVSQQRLKDAAIVYAEALQLRPGSARQHFNLGAVWQNLGDHPSALAQLQTAAQLQPEFAEAHYRLALSLRALGRVDEARREYAEARRLQPGLPELRF